jgi:hypothetical protein
MSDFYKSLIISKLNLTLIGNLNKQKPRRSAKAKGLTTQSDKNQKKWRPEPTLKNGAYSEKPYE